MRRIIVNNIIKSRSKLTLYGSLKKINMKISRKGIRFYTLLFANRKGFFEVQFVSKLSREDIKLLYSSINNRLNLQVIPYTYYNNVDTLRYNRRDRNTVNLKLIGSVFDSTKN